MPWVSDSVSQLPLITSLFVLCIGLYFRGFILWMAVAFVLCFLLVIDRDSIVTLVIYAFTGLLLIAGYQRIRLGLMPSKSGDGSAPPQIVLDGNNLLGTADWEFQPLKDFVSELECDGFGVHIFFDHSVHRLLREKNLIEPTETVPMALCRVMEINRNHITVSKKGHKADALLIRHADRNKLTVLSNDRFNKKSEDRFYFEAARRLHKAELIKRVGMFEGRLTIL